MQIQPPHDSPIYRKDTQVGLGCAIAALIAFVMACAVALSGASNATAAELAENIITSAKLSSTTIQPNQRVELEMEFRLPNNTVHKDDTSTIRLPDGFAFYTEHDFDVTDPAGNVIAHAKIDKQTGMLTLTYTEYVERHSDITGNIKASFILANGSQPQGSRPFVLEVNGKTVQAGSIDVVPPQGDNPDELFAKYGYQNRESKQDLTFVLRVNGRGDHLRNVRVTDRLDSAGIDYDRSSFEVLRGDWGFDGNNQYRMTNVEDLTATVKPQFDADGRGFSMDLGELPGKGVRIRYKVRAGYLPQNDEVFRNKATMTADNGKHQDWNASVVWKTASGEANGYNYTLKVVKTDKDGGKTLPGAEFAVVRNRSGEQVGTITTGEDGTGTLTGLLRDDYAITETKAPEGYEATTGSIMVNAAQFDGSTMTATVTVPNTPKPEDPQKPEQPDPEQPKPEQPKPSKPVSQQAKPTPLANTGSTVHVIIGTAMACALLGATLLFAIGRRGNR